MHNISRGDIVEWPSSGYLSNGSPDRQGEVIAVHGDFVAIYVNQYAISSPHVNPFTTKHLHDLTLVEKSIV